MAFKVVACTAIVLIALTIIIWKLIEGKPRPQNSGDNNVNLSTANIYLPNICTTIEEAYNKELYVSNYIGRLKLDQTSADVRLVHAHWSSGAHKIVLAAYSETFEQIFIRESESDAQKGRITEFEIPDRDADSFVALLEFIYEQKVPTANFIVLKNLLFVAERYQVHTLKCLLEQKLQSDLSISNVGNVLLASIVANATFLRNAASHFLLENLTPVLKTDTWKKVSQDNPSIYGTALESSATYSKNSSTCLIQCASGGWDSATIINRLKRFFITERFANAELIVPNQRTFKVNRAILAEQSDVWREKFRVDESSTSITLPLHTDAYALKEFLIYMYSGWVAQLNVITNNLLIIASEYEMLPLKNATETIISTRLDVSNVAEYFPIADQAQSARLKKQLVEFFFENRIDIVKTDGWKKMKETHLEILSKIIFDL